MKANELRIGNWVVDVNEPEPIQISLDDFHHLAIHEPAIENYTPIPLTEDWLTRFGADFKLVEGSHRFFTLDKDRFQSYDIFKAMPNMPSNELWSFVINNQDGKRYELYSIKNVHQLQNLYFALTGEEL